MLAAAAVIVRVLSPGMLEGGDGVQHYQIARYAWQHPELFLDHWGKPLFTLLSSPFAQLGHWGMTVFNALCFFATSVVASTLLDRAGLVAKWLYAPMLLVVPVYGTMVLAGMTEVLFGLLTVVVVGCLYAERYAVALVVLSFMPFSRPEYLGFAPFVLSWLIYRGQWRWSPLILVGHLIYGVLGWIFLGDPLWTINRDPYTGAGSIYGSGDPLHFVDHAQEIYGVPLVACMGLSIICLAYLWYTQPKERGHLALLTVLCLLPTMAIGAIHSILWWQGWKGSLGLVRVLATTAPIISMFTLWCVVRVANEWFTTRAGRTLAVASGGGLYFWWAVNSFLTIQPIPVQTDTTGRFLSEVSRKALDAMVDGSRLIYFHPQVAYFADMDPWDEDRALRSWGLDPSAPMMGMRAGDVLVWDAHFGPNEGRTQLKTLLDRTDLDLVEVCVPWERMQVLGGHVFEAYLFVARPSKSRSIEVPILADGAFLDSTISCRIDTLVCDGRGDLLCLRSGEFPFEVSRLPLFEGGGLFSEIVVKGEYGVLEEPLEEVDLVVTEDLADSRLGYWAQPLKGGRFSCRFTVPARGAASSVKLYVWNKHGRPIRLNGLSISVIRTTRSE